MTMSKNHLTADELITGTHIAARIVLEHPDLDEGKIDAALNDAYVTSVSAEEWEARTRTLLGINPYWRKEEC